MTILTYVLVETNAGEHTGQVSVVALDPLELVARRAVNVIRVRAYDLVRVVLGRRDAVILSRGRSRR